ncbi:MAG TPA: HAMP domain-containing sensor histidine kinase [Nannocystaceae bacterium]|nr:HAMP domain-containing sensor histidine kinase [Nannocystaceae bacterium]
MADGDDDEHSTARLATLGLVAAGIGHDLRNPLAVIESSAFILRRIVADERGLRHVETIAKAVQSCNRIVSSLLELTRLGPVDRRPVHPEDVLAGALGQIVVPKSATVNVVVEDGLIFQADGGLLEQVVANLVANALHSLDGRTGTITVSAQRRDDGAEIAVSDDGPGFDPAILPHAFDPLVTGRLAGVGLGLALVRSIADRHGGRVVAENRPGGGAVVRLWLPASRERSTP